MTVSHDMFVRVYFYRPVKSNGTRSDTSTSELYSSTDGVWMRASNTH